MLQTDIGPISFLPPTFPSPSDRFKGVKSVTTKPLFHALELWHEKRILLLYENKYQATTNNMSSFGVTRGPDTPHPPPPAGFERDQEKRNYVHTHRHTYTHTEIHRFSVSSKAS